MINLEKLKSLFIVDEESTKPKTNETPVNANKEDPKTITQNPPPPVTTTNGNFDEKQYNILMQAIEASNQQGFDYLEFKNSLKALDGLPIDEATKYKSAYATASTLGLTTETLLQSLNFYKGVLDKEKESFKDTLQQQIEQKITGKARELDHLNEQIKLKSEQIKQLTDEITKHQLETQQVKTYIDEVHAKIELTKNNFITTYEKIAQQFTTDIEKINTYLIPKK